MLFFLLNNNHYMAKEDIRPGISLYRFDPESMRSLCESLSEESLTLTSFEDDHIEGLIEVSEDKALVLSMPISDGWEIWLDGDKRVEPSAFLGLFVMIPVRSGLHHISLTYHVPYFKTGFLLSLISVLISAAVIIGETVKHPFALSTQK